VDCLQKAQWAAEHGGPQLPNDVVTLRRPMDLVYFGNRLRVTGHKHLRFTKLRPDSSSTNCVTSCCHTTLLVDHTYYDGKCLLLFPDLVELETVLDPPTFVNGSLDWPPKKLKELPPEPPIGQRVDASGCSWSDKNHAELPPAFEGSVTFEELLGGRDPEVLGLAEDARSWRLRSQSDE